MDSWVDKDTCIKIKDVGGVFVPSWPKYLKEFDVLIYVVCLCLSARATRRDGEQPLPFAVPLPSVPLCPVLRGSVLPLRGLLVLFLPFPRAAEPMQYTSIFGEAMVLSLLSPLCQWVSSRKQSRVKLLNRMKTGEEGRTQAGYGALVDGIL